MNLASSMIREFEPAFTFTKALKAVLAILAYGAALAFTWMYMTTCVALSYAFGNQMVVTMWTVYFVLCVAVWFAAGWAVFALTVPKGQHDAHLALLPVSLLACVTVGAATLIASYVGIASHSVLATNLYAVGSTAIAGWILFRLFNKAAATWRGESFWLL